MLWYQWIQVISWRKHAIQPIKTAFWPMSLITAWASFSKNPPSLVMTQAIASVIWDSPLPRTDEIQWSLRAFVGVSFPFVSNSSIYSYVKTNTGSNMKRFRRFSETSSEYLWKCQSFPLLLTAWLRIIIINERGKLLHARGNVSSWTDWVSLLCSAHRCNNSACLSLAVC